MGTTLSVATGFGFAVPVEVVLRWNERHRGDDDEGFGELMWDLCKVEPLLEHDSAYYYDYGPDEEDTVKYVVFVKSTIKTEYGAGVFQTDTSVNKRPNADELNAMFRVAEALGIEPGLQALEYLTVVSIG